MIQIDINWIVKINYLGVYEIYVFILRVSYEDVYIYIMQMGTVIHEDNAK